MAYELEVLGRELLCGGELRQYKWDAWEPHRIVRVWLPPAFDVGRERLRCFWFNDGQNMFRDEDSSAPGCWGAAGTAAHLIEAGCIPRVILIGIDHRYEKRSYDYLPVGPGGWAGMRGEMELGSGGGLADYLDRVVGELLPWAESTFNVSPKAEDRFFGGSSFGGICSLYMALRHGQSFGGVMIESPSFWVAAEGFDTAPLMADVEAHAGKEWPQRIYLATGACEYTGTRGTARQGSKDCDAFLARTCGDCARHMAKQGVGAERLDWHVEAGAAHTEADWCRRLPRALRWLCAAEAPPSTPLGAGFWTRPSPVVPGRAFEFYADAAHLRLRLPAGGASPQVHLGFDGWTAGVGTHPLLPAGLAAPTPGGCTWLAALVRAPSGVKDLKFALTDGAAWDNNGGADFELPVASA